MVTMNKKIYSIIGIGIVTVLALTMVDTRQGFADERKHNGKRGSKMQIAAAEFTGAIKGEIRIQGRKFLVTDDTMIYVVGKGLQTRRGLVVSKRPTVVRGKRVDGVLVAEMIIVRPEKGGSTSRPAGAFTPSPSNPNVGELDNANAH